jgi:2-amino-4-hydroxy-6-hydroxymethyldihydropteridine diphosphokinase
MTRVYLSLGSNMGDRERNIADAIRALGENGVRVLRRSALYETEPVEMREQGWFLNCVVEAETDLPADELMRGLLGIERSLGRERLVPNGPRTLDIDILFYGERVVETPTLKIPHPRMNQRRFVLVPFVEIAPAARHPILKKSVSDLLKESADRSEVRVFRKSQDLPEKPLAD